MAALLLSDGHRRLSGVTRMSQFRDLMFTVNVNCGELPEVTLHIGGSQGWSIPACPEW